MPEKLQDILARLQADDKALFRQLFHQYYPMVCRTSFRVLREIQQSEDVAQNVFIRFWEKRKELNIQTSLPAYLSRMAFNESLSYLRKQDRISTKTAEAPVSLHSAPSVEEQYIGQELDGHIREAIGRLPPRCQEIFALSRYEELSYREISERLDISPKTVENQMGKALRLLRESLKPFIGKK